ncbi:GyrI-like domain-containing protein [Methylobacterium soli]|uniref:GyrI-like domain-containing protein n=2 Tax=Methylobacterium soli TaxID=553447 RepID=A0A6L3SWV4_9HYPH|nr:GyrI-like domain-containing protein [Methylobacterium soli]
MASGPVPGLVAGAAQAQQPSPPANAPPPASTVPPPAVTSPLPTTTAPDTAKSGTGPSTAPSATQAVTPPMPSPPPGVTAPASRQTLVAAPGDANDVDEVSLPPKPAAILSGKAKWEEAVPSLKAAFARIEAELAKAGITPTGRPIAVFAKTDDDGFQYEAMIPVAPVPDSKAAEGKLAEAGSGDGGPLRLGTTPSGKALRFPHKGSYDEIDGTYETLTAYLDAKDVVVQDRFIEEYVTDLKDRADEKLDVNIYALVK